MNATAADLIERVLPPESGLRQWVLTFPFSWRRRLAQDGALLGRLTRTVVETVLTSYAARAAQEGRLGAKSGAVTVVQRTSSDLRLNPHLHLVVLDGAWYEDGGELAWEGLSHLGTSEVREVLERVVRRIERHLRRCGLLGSFGDEAEPDGEGDPEGNLAASAVWGQTPPAGPQWVSRLAPLQPHALGYDKPLCASLDGFTLHAATRAGAFHPAGREALLRYVLRPPIAQERLEHTIRYSGVLAPANPWRRSLAPMAPSEIPADGQSPPRQQGAPSCRPWAEPLARTFAVDVLACPKCHGRMMLLAMVEDPANVARYLAAVGDATEVPPRSPGRGPPYWKSRVLRRQALGEEDDGQGRWAQETA